VFYYRGDLFDVIDAGQLLGNEARISNEPPYVILLKWDQKSLGLIPERIVGMTWVEEENSHGMIFTKEGLAIHMMIPENIWKRLSELPYGH